MMMAQHGRQVANNKHKNQTALPDVSEHEADDDEGELEMGDVGMTEADENSEDEEGPSEHDEHLEAGDEPSIQKTSIIH